MNTIPDIMLIIERGMILVITAPINTPSETITAKPIVAPIPILYGFSCSNERLKTIN